MISGMVLRLKINDKQLLSLEYSDNGGMALTRAS
jgi:hypothetical protein